MTLLDLLALQRRSRGSASAILAPGRDALSYAALHLGVENAGKALASIGIGRDSRVAVALPNSLEAAVALLATSTWSTCAPLNPRLDANDGREVFEQLRISALIVEDGEEGPILAAARAAGVGIARLAAAERNAGDILAFRAESIRAPVHRTVPRPDDIALLLRTSGTTARPRVVPITHRMLVWPGGPRPVDHGDRFLCLWPLHTTAGVEGGLISPLARGASTVIAPGFDAAQFFGWLHALEPTYFSASPTMHAAIVEEILHHRPRLPDSLRFVRSSTGAMSAALQEKVESILGVPVVQSYGSTEAGLVAQDSPPPGRRRAGSVGIARGTEIMIVGDHSEPLPAGKDGEILVRGCRVMSGYENDSEENRIAFHEGWLRTGDLGHLDSDGYLFITGRLKEIINRGGQKVMPAEVDDVLLRHPDVREAAAFSFPHRTLGEDVVAAVVLRRSATASSHDLRAFAARSLSRYKVPSEIVIVDELPKNELGKVKRKELALQLADLAKRTVRREPRDQLELHIAKLWERLLKVSPVGVEDNFFTLGGDSIAAAQLMDAIERTFGRRLPLDALWFGNPTISGLAGLLRQDEQCSDWPTLVPIKEAGGKPPLFCVHTQGGNLFHYDELARSLGDEQPVLGLQARGVYGGPPPRRTIEEIAADCVCAMRDAQRHGPFRIVGYSSGGLIALEIARQLEAMGEQVGFLAVIDADVDRKRSLTSRLRAGGLRSIQERAYFLALKLIRRPDLRNLRSIGEAQRWAFWSYSPLPYRGDVLLLVASESSRKESADDSLGWRKLIAGQMSVHRFDGNHASIMKLPTVRQLARTLQECLDRDHACRSCDHSDD